MYRTKLEIWALQWLRYYSLQKSFFFLSWSLNYVIVKMIISLWTFVTEHFFFGFLFCSEKCFILLLLLITIKRYQLFPYLITCFSPLSTMIFVFAWNQGLYIPLHTGIFIHFCSIRVALFLDPFTTCCFSLYCDNICAHFWATVSSVTLWAWYLSPFTSKNNRRYPLALAKSDFKTPFRRINFVTLRDNYSRSCQWTSVQSQINYEYHTFDNFLPQSLQSMIQVFVQLRNSLTSVNFWSLLSHLCLVY